MHWCSLAAAKEMGREQAVFFKDMVCPKMLALREPIDKLEGLVDQDYWPVPSYSDLLFEV